MRYLGVRRTELEDEARRNGGDVVDAAREEDEDEDEESDEKGEKTTATFISEDEDEDDEDEDGDATTVNAETMTGTRRYPHDGATSGAFRAMDVIEALGLERREESTAWTRVEEGRREEEPEKIDLETNPRLYEKEDAVRHQTSLVPMMETPVQEYEGETEAMKRKLILAANIGASDASKMFQLSESELNALDCVENDLQQRFDVCQSQPMEEDAEKEAGKLVDYSSLTPSTVEPMCIFTPEELLSPLHLLLSMTEKIDEHDISSEIFIESEDSRMYLKNLLRPAKLETQQARRDIPERVNMNDGIFPKLMEDVNPETTHVSLQKALEPLTTRAEEHATMALPDDLLTKTKEDVTQKLLEVPGWEFQLKPMQVPEIDDGKENFEARTTQIMENIVDSIKDFKQQSKFKPSWNAPFPNFLQAMSEVKYDADSDELPSFVPAMDDVAFINDAEDWSWDGLTTREDSKEAQKKAAEEISQYPALSESKSLTKSEAKNCSIDTVELRLESQHNEMLDIFAQRYTYITQILPLDIQAKVPQFEPSDSQALTDMLKHFKHESSTILGHLSSLLCCQIAAHLMQTYGIHDTYSYMNNRTKNEPDLQDITRLLERHDATVQKGTLINHPKLRELKSLLARLVVTGGKMLLIFPSVMGILSIKRFVAKCGMRVSQFDAKQEFKHMTSADYEDFARAVSIAAEGSDVLIVLEEHLAQECFPLKLFSTCVYYAPSLDTISSVTALRHSMNEFVFIFKVKDERHRLQELEPASSAFNHAPAEKSNQQAVDTVFDEPFREASPTMDLSGVPRHVVVMNTSRQIFKARELLFLETQALLSKEGYEVVFRESSIDVDACVTRVDRVHAVIMIVPEYFAEDYPSQLEILSLSEDLTAAMANSFHSGTIVFEGNLDFLRLAQSIERRLCLDSKQLGIELDVKYYIDIDVIEGLFSVLSCGSESSNFSGSIPNKPSGAESELCSAFPMLNPISACMMLADDKIKNVLDITGRVDREVIEYVRTYPVLGCPLSVLGDSSPSPQANAFESGILSPRDSELRPSSRRLEHVTDETFRNLRSFSLDESPMGPSIQQRKVDIPSPALDLSTSPPGTPRSLFSPVSQRYIAGQQNPPTATARGRLWQTKPRQEPPKAPSRAMGSPSTFPNIVESYRMPRTTQDARRLHSTDMNRDLTQHRFSRIQSSNKKRLPDDWK